MTDERKEVVSDGEVRQEGSGKEAGEGQGEGQEVGGLPRGGGEIPLPTGMFMAWGIRFRILANGKAERISYSGDMVPGVTKHFLRTVECWSRLTPEVRESTRWTPGVKSIVSRSIRERGDPGKMGTGE